MSKRKYILKRQDLYNASNNDFIIEHKLQSHTKPIQKYPSNPIQINQLNNNLSNCLKLNDSPKDIPQEEKNQFIQNFYKPVSLKQSISQTSKDHQNHNQNQPKVTTALKQKDTNKLQTKKHQTPIGFSSSLHKTPHIKTQNIKSKAKRQKSKEKSTLFNEKIKNKSIEKLNFSQALNLTARSASGQKRIVKQKISVQNQNSDKKIEPNEDHSDNDQCLKIDSIISSNIQNQKQKQNMIQQNLTIKKQKQPHINQTYLKQIDSQLHFLQTQIKNEELKNKQLEQILSGRQAKLDQQQKQCIRLYKQNKDLSDMIRDIEQLMHKKSLQFEKSLFQLNNKLKQKEYQYKILQAQRDTLLRKKDRQNQQISKLYQTIKLKDTQIITQKQKEHFLISENQSLIQAYQTIKLQLQQILKINQTERFFQNLIEKGQQQTHRNHMQISAFRCSRCHQTVLGNQNTAEELAKHHMNEKFKNHIKTYQEEVKYWKDQLKFIKTQHQHEIQNIRTVLQCTFQKNLIEKQTKYAQEIAELKKTILVQEDLIKNYKRVIERRDKVSVSEPQSQTQRNDSIELRRETSLRLENIETARSRSYLTDRKVIQEVLAEEENRPRQNKATIKMKECDPPLKESLLKSSLLQDDSASILDSFKKKVQLSDSSLNSRIARRVQSKDREPLSELKN